MSKTLPNMLEGTIAKIREMVDVNSVIGNPITTPDGVTIIPVSKISVGYASGGLDYAVKNEPVTSAKPKNFGGGGGTGLSISPVGFLTVKADGSVEIVNINAPVGTVEQVADVIERAPEIVAKFKALFTKNKKEKAAKTEAAPETDGETMEISIDAE